METRRRNKSVKSKKLGLPTLRRKAWALFSQYIRQKHANFAEMVKCVSCEQWIPWKDAHAGHFVHASKQSRLSYDERNVHPQCVACNYYGMKGMAAIQYTLFMLRVYGREVIDELTAMKYSKQYLKRSDLEQLIEKYEKYTNA